jgi:hypothetical protein
VPGILSDTELMEQLNIDPTRWRITKVQYDRKDTYKGAAINPMINVKVSLEPKVAEMPCVILRRAAGRRKAFLSNTQNHISKNEGCFGISYT